MLYFNALQHGLAPMPAADPALRAALVAELATRGASALHAELRDVDPKAAARIHPNDPQRLLRALEVWRASGTPLSELQAATRSALDEPVVKLALVPGSRAWLHARIERRLDAMLGAGLLDEARALRALPGYDAALPAMRSVGYRQALQHLDAFAAAAGAPSGTATAVSHSVPDWRERALVATRQLAKRQLTWLRGMDDAVNLACDSLDGSALLAAALDAVATPRHPGRAPHRYTARMNARPEAAVPSFPPPPLYEQVGHTRLVPLSRIGANERGNLILGKLEGDNPAGSVKDRPAANMILQAAARGEIRPGDTLVEATSGNTGIALAMVAAAAGYRMRLLMPDNMTDERKSTMLAFGAELVLVSEEEGMEFARDEAARMGARGDGLVLDQFANPDCWGAHYLGTGPELWAQTEGRITHFVSSMGTTGTIMGTSRYLKERDAGVRIVGVQPEDGSSIPGIRRWPAAYLPKIYEPERVDEIQDVSQGEAEAMARRLAREEGVFAGVSSGGALVAALRIAEAVENAVIVTIVCDRGDRYLSSGLFPARASGPRTT